MSNFDDGEGFAVGDDDIENTTYKFDIDEERAFLRDRMTELFHDADEGTAYADDLMRRVVRGQRGTFMLDRRETHARVQTVLNETDDQVLRALIANEVLTLFGQASEARRG
jgi:hypothetical protein